jgi:NADH-quinone oxidoreductase subunit G
VHPDGRVQRLRAAIGRPGSVRAEWQILAELEARIGGSAPVLTGPMASAQLFAAVPFYAGLTLEEIGGRGVRWQERDALAAAPAAPAGPFDIGTPVAAPTPNGALRLGTYRSIWAAQEVEISPALKFLAARQQAELSPADAERLGLENGDRVEIGVATAATNGAAPTARITATVALRGNVPAGTVFLGEATASQSATALLGTDDAPRLVDIALVRTEDEVPA